MKLLTNKKYNALLAEIESLRSPVFPKEWKPKMKMVLSQDGIKYYEPRNPVEMPYKRGIMAQIAMKEAARGLTEEESKRYREEIDRLFNSGEIGQMYHIVATLFEQMEIGVSVEALERLASIWIVRHDENIMDFDQEIADEKLAHWKGDEKMNDFFLQEALKLTHDVGNTSPETIRKWLAEAQSVSSELQNRLLVRTS